MNKPVYEHTLFGILLRPKMRGVFKKLHNTFTWMKNRSTFYLKLFRLNREGFTMLSINDLFLKNKYDLFGYIETEDLLNQTSLKNSTYSCIYRTTYFNIQWVKCSETTIIDRNKCSLSSLLCFSMRQTKFVLYSSNFKIYLIVWEVLSKCLPNW